MTIQERLTAQLQKPENQICADCKAHESSYFKSTDGIFLCPNCSDIHRDTISLSSSRMIPINSRNFTETDIFFMETIGNKISNEYYEHSLNPEDIPNLNNADNIRQFIIDKYRNKRWVNIREYPPGSIRRALFGRKSLFQYFIHFMEFLNFVFCLFLLTCLAILFLCIIYKKVLIATTFSCMIAIEVYEAQLPKKSIYNFGIDLLIEMLLSVLGFGLFKGILTAASVKMIAKGIEYGGKSCLLFAIAAILISIGFGFENMITSAISFIIIFTCAYFYFDSIRRGDVMYFGYVNK